MSDDALPEPDRIDGAPHPSETPVIFGQNRAEAAFLEAYTSGRLHHGWLLTGPRGVGKATLAWRIAKFLLATPDADDGGLFGDAPAMPETLDIAPDHPVVRRMMSGAEGRLFVLRRAVDEKTNRLRAVITVDEARKLKHFFAFSAADGGRRVVIVDAADEMNVSAANALLKVLEEPPEKTFLILISHQPSRLLPTIRSRCRELRLAQLGTDDMARALAEAGVAPDAITPELLALADGSVGEAVQMLNLDGPKLYAAILSVLSGMSRFDRAKALALAEMTAGKGKEDQRALLFHLIDLVLARLARTGVLGPGAEAMAGEADLFARLSPTPDRARAWATTAQEISDRNQHGLAVNLDPAALILDTVFKIHQTAGG